MSGKEEAIESKATRVMYEFASIIQEFQAELIMAFEMDGAKAMEMALQHAMEAQASRGPDFVLSQEDRLKIQRSFRTTWDNLGALRGICMGFYGMRPNSEGGMVTKVICNATAPEARRGIFEDPLAVIVEDQLGYEITSKLGL